ncbi:MAG: protein TolQ [Pseudomonadota bacterium]
MDQPLESAPTSAPAVVMTDNLGGQAADLSPLGLFLQSDIVVQVVMALLVLSSIWSWGIILDKWLRYGRMKRLAGKFEDQFYSTETLDEFNRAIGKQKNHPFTQAFSAAMEEWQRSGQAKVKLAQGGLGLRLETTMRVTVQREMQRLEKGLGFLATVGSVAPFIGLFGTVWGIMNAFTSIAASQNTSLAVVAPGIAEALFATALGLVAAIPAVTAYNKFSADLDRYGQRLDGFCDELSAIFSRQLDSRA